MKMEAIDVGRKSLNYRWHNRLKVTGRARGRATASRNNGAAWIVDFVNLRQEISMRVSGSGVVRLLAV